MRSFPFFGKGVSFPFRLNPKGGVLVTEGNTDNLSVALSYLYEKWTIREKLQPFANHIAESIMHILLTVPEEHETLPEFGSYIFKILFEPNAYNFKLACSRYFVNSTRRWEKRARVRNEQSVLWLDEHSSSLIGTSYRHGGSSCISGYTFCFVSNRR